MKLEEYLECSPDVNLSMNIHWLTDTESRYNFQLWDETLELECGVRVMDWQLDEDGALGYTWGALWDLIYDEYCKEKWKGD